jgi:hypothetical protein
MECLSFSWARLVCAAALVAIASTALEAEEKPKAKGPLSELPSKPGGHIDKIAKLGDNAWLDLGSPGADPKWGKARGRSWSCKMPLAPDLRGAFLFGEGVHGYVKPDGHFMDDLWFYDLNGHRWICCYPGMDAKKLDFKINEHGIETNGAGRPVPIASMGHAYEMVTYDPGSKKFLSMPCPAGYYTAYNKKRQELLKDRVPAKVKGLSPWSFDGASGEWDRRTTETVSPSSSFGDVLMYVPTKKQVFFRHGEEVWFFDPPKNKWAQAKVKGPKPPFGIDPTACYDSKRDRIYMGGGSYPSAPKGTNALWIYDLKTNSWIDPQPKGSAGGSTSYATNYALMAYDSVNDVVVLIRHAAAKEHLGVFIYTPAINSWSDGPVSSVKATGRCKSGFYDAALNAHFVFGAGDSDDDGTMWVYRYKRAKR